MMQFPAGMQYVPKFLEAAEKGGEVLLKYFGQSLDGKEKSMAADIQTKADLESEAVILPILEKAFPDFDIHAEENGRKNKDSEYTIVVDPLDGTNNFVAGIPNFTVIIALVHKKRSIAGLIYQPTTRRAFYAEEGKGAYCNGKRINVSKEEESTKAAIAYVAGYHNAGREVGPVATSLYRLLKMKRFHYNWAGAFDDCMLASGKIESVIWDGAQPYDFLAGKLICREAGAKITGIDGQPEPDDLGDVFLVSNGTSLHEKILEAWRLVRS